VSVEHFLGWRDARMDLGERLGSVGAKDAALGRANLLAETAKKLLVRWWVSIEGTGGSLSGPVECLIVAAEA